MADREHAEWAANRKTRKEAKKRAKIKAAENVETEPPPSPSPRASDARSGGSMDGEETLPFFGY